VAIKLRHWTEVEVIGFNRASAAMIDRYALFDNPERHTASASLQ